MAARVPENVSEFASPYDLKQVSTDQKVGSSNLPGRAIFSMRYRISPIAIQITGFKGDA